MTNPQLAAGSGMDHRAIGGAVVGHRPLDLHVPLGEPGHRAAQEGRGGLPTFVRQHLDVCESSGISTQTWHRSQP
jgi:hypothetical protein